ncbi:Glutaredoxin [Alteromonadaceae bacterium Bs31]|nr:Glutaredoxin [Alteromonadaceae bacterium Bs31]
MSSSQNGLTHLEHITLYHRPSCGYCRRVYRALEDLQLSINDINLGSDYDARVELYKHGGKSQVPAIRIELGNGKTQWMYESLDIIDYLRTQLER